MQSGKVNGRAPFGTWSSEMLRTVGRVPHTGGKKNSRLIVLGKRERRAETRQNRRRERLREMCSASWVSLSFLVSEENINEKGSSKEQQKQ